MQFGRTNVNKFLIEEQRRNPALAGDFSMLISDVVRSCKAISQVISRGALAGFADDPWSPNPHDDELASPAHLANQAFLNHCVWGGHLTALTSSEAADISPIPNEGVRGKKAKDWRLVDDIAKPAQFAATVQARALELAAQSDRPADGKGVTLTALDRSITANALTYTHVTVDIDRAKRTATFTVKAPTGAQPTDVAGIEVGHYTETRRPTGCTVVLSRGGAVGG